MKKTGFIIIIEFTILFIFCSCRHDVVVDFPSDVKPGNSDDTPSSPDAPVGFYLLDQGNMGMNKAAIDFYDYRTGLFTRDMYLRANPDAVMALGDVGNEIAIYDDKLWAIINCSNKVEVMNASDCRRIGQIDIPNCRHMVFYGDYAYITSYAGPVIIDDNYNQLGYVAKINIHTLKEEKRCIVRFQPDGIAVSEGKLYVANSGGYRPNNYERTLSIIDLGTFNVIKEVELGINLNLVKSDPEGKIWISSRGDYYDVMPYLYCYDPKIDKVVASMDKDASSMWINGDLLYYIGNSFSYETMTSSPTFGIIDTRTIKDILDSWDSSSADPSFPWHPAKEFFNIKSPYCLAINPSDKGIYITDAGNYVNPGYIYSFTSDGKFLWRQRAGDVPASIAFLFE